MRNVLILAAIAALAFASAADAKSCKDASGKFITCPSASAAATSDKARAATEAKAAKAQAKAAKADAKTAKAADKTANKKSASAAKSAAAAPAAPAPAATASTTGKVPNCKTGKLCGHACISKDKVCHK